MTQYHQAIARSDLLPGFVAKLAAGSLLVLAIAAGAQAGSSVFLTPVADLGALPFSSDSGLNPLPASNDWVSYILGVSTDDGSKIQAVDVNLKGPFGQTWNWDTDSNSFASTPSSLNITGSDSHLMLPANALSAVNPTEDINALPASGSTGFGLGSTMHGVWAVPGAASATASMDLAYLVMPRGLESQLEYAIDGADGNGNMLFQFRQGASFPPPPPPPAPLPSPPAPMPTPPAIVDQPPILPPAGTTTPPPASPPQAPPDISVNPPEGSVITIDPLNPSVVEPTLPSATIQVIKMIPGDGTVVNGGTWTIMVAGTSFQLHSLTYDAISSTGEAIYANGAAQLISTYFVSGGFHSALAGLSGKVFARLAAPSMGDAPYDAGLLQPFAMAGPEPAAAPEPAGLLLAVVALAGLAGFVRRNG
jgi:hypothetical protein